MLEQRVAERDAQCQQLQTKYTQYQEKVQVFAESSGISIVDVQEALAIIKWRKHNNIPLDVIMATNDLLKVCCCHASALQRQCADPTEQESSNMVALRADYLASVRDLDKAKQLLAVQESINSDYKRDLQQLRTKWDNVRVEYDTRVSELSRLLDIRQTRILRLERQLKSTLYGKRSADARADGDNSDDEDNEDGSDSTPALLVTLASLHLKRAASINSVYFVTSDFYTFDTVVSPLGMGVNAQFNFAVRFPLVLEHATLAYLHRHSFNVDLWELRGSTTEALGRCCIPLMGLLELSGGMHNVRCTADLFGSTGDVRVCATCFCGRTAHPRCECSFRLASSSTRCASRACWTRPSRTTAIATSQLRHPARSLRPPSSSQTPSLSRRRGSTLCSKAKCASGTFSVVRSTSSTVTLTPVACAACIKRCLS